MARNVELKAKVNDFPRLLEKAKLLSGNEGTLIKQKDVFYKTPKGRLKMRFFEDGSGELIFYERPDTSGPKTSEYHIHPTADPSTLHGVLVSSPGVAGLLVKTRTLFMLGQARLHLDQVEDLGNFMELEVVLNENQSAEDGEHIANELYRITLGMDPADLVSGSYFDLKKKETHGEHTAL